MRTTIIVKIRGAGYMVTVYAQPGDSTPQGARIGLTPQDAATRAAELMLQYAVHNPDGGDLMAPPEVLELIPSHLHSIAGRKAMP